MSAPPQRLVYNEIKGLFNRLVPSGLVDDQNPPVQKSVGPGRSAVSYANSMPGALFLKKIPYLELYQQIRSHRAYNFRMLDGAVVQLDYEFEGRGLVRHRLAFLPSPQSMQYQNDPRTYQRDEVFGDIVDPRQVAVPLRFDYDIRAHAAAEHPSSHLTLGQYEHCRIPVTSAVTPTVFMQFLLTSFYTTDTPHRDTRQRLPVQSELTSSQLRFPSRITDRQRRMLHIKTP